MGIEEWRTPQARERFLAAFRARDASFDTLVQPAVVNLQANWPDTVAGLAADELLGHVLVTAPVFPARLEHRLTDLRRGFLSDGVTDDLLPLAARLAIQCQLNEYVWAVEEAEAAQAADLAARLADLSAGELVVLACYRPLATLPGADALLARDWPAPVRDVLEEQLVQVREEQRLAAEAPALTGLRGRVSQAVQAQYEAHPYPRWRAAPLVSPITHIQGWPVPPAAQVLIAGCGTGRQAIQAARRYVGAQVLAVDLSRASLGYALRKTREAGLANIEYAQADLLELGGLDRGFDIIECSGVLHHLEDPFEGARVLASRLRPGGVMKLALYSAAARRRLRPAKALARRYGAGAIRELRQAILSAPLNDPVRAGADSLDFFAASSCRDLLMHVQEHELEIADLRRMLAENGLRFGGFVIGEEVLGAYRAAFPDDPRGVNLENWAAFEDRHPMTFQGMYQFWTRKPA